MSMPSQKIPPKTLICTLRVAPSFYAALEQAVRDTNDPTVRLWQGQAKTYPDGTINPSLFVQDNFDDHPGKPLPADEKVAIQDMLRDPSYTLRIVNSFAGDHAEERDSAGTYAIMAADIEYREQGGVGKIVYDLLYDGNGRNDKKHVVQFTDASGATRKISEGNIPTGMYAPIKYRRLGADAISVFDPHSKAHRNNLKHAFGEAAVGINSSLDAITDNILARYRNALIDGTFRIGAPDGWDKKDDRNHNEAIIRVQKVVEKVWEKMPELQEIYEDQAHFLEAIQFGIIKVRKAAYEGAPARAKFESLIGDVRNCTCLLLDDLADSGNSLVQSGAALLGAGALQVDAAICHGPACKESIDLILHDTFTMPDGKATLVINHLTLTNTMPRVEKFYEQLPEKDRRRTTLINCADKYLDYICAPAPKPQAEPETPAKPLGFIIK